MNEQEIKKALLKQIIADLSYEEWEWELQCWGYEKGILSKEDVPDYVVDDVENSGKKFVCNDCDEEYEATREHNPTPSICPDCWYLYHEDK